MKILLDVYRVLLIGCNFVFGGDMNVSKVQHSAFYKVVDYFCKFNDFLWLDPVDGSVDYTYHNEKNGCLLYTSPSPRDGLLSRMPSSA